MTAYNFLVLAVCWGNVSADRPSPTFSAEVLVLPSLGTGLPRFPLHADPVEAALVAGSWKTPEEGTLVRNEAGKEQKWTKASLEKDGWLKHPALRGGYAYVPVDAPETGVWLLQASGHSLVYVNGALRVGDVYQSGNVLLPIELQKGRNDLLFFCQRGQVQMKLTAPRGRAQLHNETLLPDLLVGPGGMLDGSAVVLNNTREKLHLALVAQLAGADATTRDFHLEPCQLRAIPFDFEVKALDAPGKRSLKIRLLERHKGTDKVLEERSFELAVQNPTDLHRRTFVSHIDRSVQYYAVRPASRKAGQEKPGLILSLHGAAVDAGGHAASYASKSWAHVVAPTNRRPFGFDWEDWGRLDALEVLAHSVKDLQTDPTRVVLTGHSMGGHGVWHLGATYPDRFAAIGPSAGWISFWTYGMGPRPQPSSKLLDLIARPHHASDTPLLAANFAQQAVYILHGDADDNVPVSQARAMKKILEPLHKDLHYHEQSKAGHWWDDGPDPGVGCVDWKPMMDLFQKRRLPQDKEVDAVQFVTANPGISARSSWVEIVGQLRHLEISKVNLKLDRGQRDVRGTTSNVARLRLFLADLPPGQPVKLELDQDKLETPWPKQGILHLTKKEGKWAAVDSWPKDDKNPLRYGPFRDVFRNQVVFIYGTQGTPQETAWARHKAHYDAETFWYRGNGAIQVLADRDVDPRRYPYENMVLYGNADTHGLWQEMLGDSSVQVRRGQIQVGERLEKGDDLACLFIQPRRNALHNDHAMVGAISGTGLVGMRLTDRLPLFASGIAYPDLLVLSADMLRGGPGGVRAAGYFGLDWGVPSGEFAWWK